jgi:hypothetical protein
MAMVSGGDVFVGGSVRRDEFAAAPELSAKGRESFANSDGDLSRLVCACFGQRVDRGYRRIPDGFRVGTMHTRIAIIGIFTMMAALIVDGSLMKRAGFGSKVLWPFRVYGFTGSPRSLL